jgi:FkbM family methyltransferase
MHAPTALRLTGRRVKAYGRYARGIPHEPCYEYFRRDRRMGVFLDVGANLGTSAMSIRTVMPHAMIVSLEPNPVHSRDLKWAAHIVGNMHVRNVAASDEPGILTLHVPQRGHAPVTGEASLELDGLAETYGQPNIRAVEVHATTIDELGVRPLWMKIDVEGHADRVLRGAEDTLRACKPTIMVESDGRTNAAVLEHLGRLGYSPHVWLIEEQRLADFRDKMMPQNIIFCPGGSTQSS